MTTSKYKVQNCKEQRKITQSIIHEGRGLENEICRLNNLC